MLSIQFQTFLKQNPAAGNGDFDFAVFRNMDVGAETTGGILISRMSDCVSVAARTCP